MLSSEHAIGRAILGAVSGARSQLGPVDTELGAGVAGEEVYVRQPGPATPSAVEPLLDTVEVELEPTGSVIFGVDDETELVVRANAGRNGSRPDNLAVGARAAGNGVLDVERITVAEMDVERDVLGRRSNLIAFLPVFIVTYEKMIFAREWHHIFGGLNIYIPLEDNQTLVHGAQPEVVANIIGLVDLWLVAAVGHSLDLGAPEMGVTLEMQRGSPVGGVGFRLDKDGVSGLSVGDMAAKLLAFELDISQNASSLTTGVVDDELRRNQEGSRHDEDE